MSETKHMEYMMKDILKRLTNLNEKFVMTERKLDNAVFDFEAETDDIKSFKEDFDNWRYVIDNHIEEDHFYIKDDIEDLKKNSEALIQLKYKCEDLETLCGKLNQRMEELERRYGGSCND